MKLRLMLLLTIALLNYQPGYAQSNYLPGYIIDHKGGTIQGFIDYRNWSRNPNEIEFKKEINQNSAVYKVMDINGFVVNNELYTSAVVDAEISPMTMNMLDKTPVLRFRKNDTTFLQAIIKGTKSLYHYKDMEGKDQFYIKQGTSFELLTYKKYFNMVDDTKSVKELKTFRGQLSNYLSDCASIVPVIRTTEYGAKSLKRLFDEYYGCVGANIDFQKTAEKVKTDFGIVVGASTTKLDFPGDEYEYVAKVNYPVSTNFTAGVFLNLVLPRNRGRWSIYNELLYYTYLVKGEFINYRSENSFDIYYSEIGFSFLKMSNMLRFNGKIGNMAIFLNAGVSNGFALKETNYLKVDYKVFSNENTVESDVGRGQPLRKHELGLIVGTGLKLKQYTFEFRYESGDGVSDYVPSNTTKLFLLLGRSF